MSTSTRIPKRLMWLMALGTWIASVVLHSYWPLLAGPLVIWPSAYLIGKALPQDR